MSDLQKPETLELRVRLRFSRLIDPELYQVLSNLPESERSSLLHAMITRSALGVAMPLGLMIQRAAETGSGLAHPADRPIDCNAHNGAAESPLATQPVARSIAPDTTGGMATRIWRLVSGSTTRRQGMEP